MLSYFDVMHNCTLQLSNLLGKEGKATFRLHRKSPQEFEKKTHVGFIAISETLSRAGVIWVSFLLYIAATSYVSI